MMNSDRPAWAERLRDLRLRKSPRWSQLRAVVALEQRAAEFRLPLPSRESLLRMLKGWERGDHAPNDFYRSLWSLIYDVPESVLFAELPPSSLSALGLGLGSIVGGSSSAAVEEQMRRRTMVVGGTAAGMLALVGSPHRYRVGMIEVREVESAAHALRRWDRQFGGWVPYHAAAGHVDSAMQLVRGTCTEKVRRPLLHAVADLCAVAGWIAIDIGQSQQALGYFATGIQVAQHGSDPAMAARLICDMARINADLENSMQSVELLGVARHLCTGSGITATVRTKLLTMEAKTYAILGQKEQCRRALASAEDCVSASPVVGEEPAWIGYFDEAQFAGVVGSCYRDLAVTDPDLAADAEEPICQAIATRSTEQVRNQALDHANLATTRLYRHELDGMCEAANHALDLAVTLRSHRLSRRLRLLTRQAEPHARTHSGVRAVRSRVASMPELL